MIADDYDIVLIGSGFGAAVMAARLSEGLADRGKAPRILVLEKGNDHTGRFDPESDGPDLNAQGNRFRHTLAPEYLADVGQVYTDATGAFREGVSSMNVITGTGMGGGSNAYLGVSLRTATEVFDLQRDGRPLWPRGTSRQALNPYYAQAETRLNVNRQAWTDATAPHHQLTAKRDLVFADACRTIGATAAPLKLANANDANDGWWAQGQRHQGRQNLTENYLADALAAGVEFRANNEVETVVPDGDRYVVRGLDRRGDDPEIFEFSATLVIVAAGTVASAGILLRSEDAFSGQRALDQGREVRNVPVLGRNMSGNGDYGVTGIVGPDLERVIDGHKGKPMSSFCPSFWPSDQFILIPFYAAPLYLSQGQPSTLLRPFQPDAVGRGSTTTAVVDGRPERDWGLAYKQRLQQFSSRMLTMGCLALDESEGEVLLGPGGASFEVRWQDTHPQTEARWSTAVDTMRRIYEALGGEMYLDSYRKDGTVSTAHPLGSVRMSDDPEYGIVDELGESWTNRNLFVVDGSIVPSALGVNPTLTIAAVAERIADRLLRGSGTEALVDRLGL